MKCPGSLATGGEVVYSTSILLGEGEANVDIKNLLLCLQFQFDLLASLSHSARSSVMGASFKPETVPWTVYDIVPEFPITLTASICHKISRTH